MSFSIGIVGLPNVGKSTLFQAITKKQVEASNYPFCTIEPNVGIVPVPDNRLVQLSKLSNSAKTTPTCISFTDIAGLVKDAHKGEGLGNKFLHNIREVDAICHVVRMFDDDNVVHVDGKINPQQDMSVINLELIMADLKTIENRLEKFKKEAKSQKPETIEKQKNFLEKIHQALNNGQTVRSLDFDKDEQGYLKQLNFLTGKPVLYVFNVSEQQLQNNIQLPEVDKGAGKIAIATKTESELINMPAEEVKEYLQSIGQEMTGLDKLIKASYHLLDLISYLTTGPKETRAWTITQGTSAKKAAGVIHSDFEKGFIKAAVIFWEDLIEAGSEAKARELGLIKDQGKDYIVKDGDVIEFKFA